MSFLKDSWYLYLRLVRATRRMPIFLLLSIMQPLLWMLLFSQLFGAVATLDGFESGSYVQFITPGIAIMTALFSAAYTGLGLLRDIDGGVLNRLLATPVSRSAVVGSRVMLAASQVTAQAAVILGMGMMLGATPHGGVLGLLSVLFAAALLSAAFASASCGLALIIRRQEMVIAAMNFVILPATFLSSMIMAHALMPAWIRAVARFNPVDWAVTAARLSFQGDLGGELAVSLGLLVAFTLGCGAFAYRAFGRYQRAM